MEQQRKEISVLLIDDEVDFLEITSKRLRRRGYAVETAPSCERALIALIDAPADIIVLDVMFPDMDGIECLKRIKSHNPEQAIILLTGHASIEAGLESLKYGANDYLLKPVELEELIDKIEIVYRDTVAG
jgi:DNA-binding response OmpR family regulator